MPMLLKRAAIALIVLFLLAVGGAFLFLRSALIASLPLLDGQAPVPGLLRPVTIERDDHGVPAIRAESEIDAMRALGFLHGQERFFQMDMARRVSAGELSAVLGPATVPFDRSQRDHLFRRRARQALPLLPADHQALFEAYAEGVNAGVADLGAAPPEYLMLRQVPEPWLPEDSLLVLYTMFGMLHYSTGDERMAGVMHDALPRELLEFLLPDASRHDAPLIEPIGRDPAEIYSPAPIPGPDIVDLRSGGWSPAAPPPAEARGMLDPFNRPALGSNAWVVDASRTVDGRAILANDMHLGIQVPNIWYRAALHWGDRRVVGVTLPGVPGVVAGSTGVIAWGFTNTTGDFEDYVIVERDAEDPDLYRTPDGAERVEIRKETIEVRGAAPETYEVAMTRWGPIVATDHRDRELALRWTAHDVQHVNLGILDMPEANSIEEALQIAASFNGPSQNVMIASSTGRIAWTLCGYLPNRVGFDGRWPVSWANAETGWAGALPESLRPSAIDPPGGMLYTANNRTVHLSVARRIGRNWASGTRAARIGELLRDQESMVERDHLAIQLDAQSQAHEIYRDTILTIITDDESDPRLRRAREVAAAWDGTANADQRAYALLRAYRSALVRAVVDPLVAPCRELEPNFIYGWTQSEESVLRILEEEPPHLLPSEFESWNQLRRAALIAAIDRLERRDLPIDARWGRVNATRIHHPIAQSVPLLGRWLNMPQRPQSGDWGVVRVAAPGAGASERLVVSPGREEDAIFHMPAGQSGHFLSDHFDAGHFDWLDGAPTPLLPREPAHTLILTPGRASSNGSRP